MRNREDLPAALRRPEAPTPIRLALNPDEAAAALSICSKTLKSMPDGPPAVRIGRRVLYPVDLLAAWLRERAGNPTDAGDLSPST